MALRGAITANEVFSGNALDGNNTEFSVGSSGSERQITNVAGATQDTDAVNLRQLRTVGRNLAGTLGSSFDASSGSYTAPAYSYGGSPYTTVPNVIGAIDEFALRYDRDGNGNRLASIDLTRGNTVGQAVSITGLAPATADNGAVALSQMPLRYSTSANTTTANPAVPSNDVTLVGSTAGRTVGLHNVAPGDITTSTSTDAVNGSQLYATNQDITGLRSAVTDGTIGLVQQDGTSRTLTVGKSTDGTLVDVTGTQGLRRLTGLAAGSGDSDAATIGQLRLSGNALTSGLGGGASYDAVSGAFTAPSYNVGGRSYGNVGSALAATNNLAVQYVADGNGNPTGTVDLAKGGATPVALRGVAAGQVASGSTEAINGGQLDTTNQQVAGNTAGLGSLNTGLANGTIGLVQQDGTSRTLTVGKSTDGTLVDLTGTQGLRRLTGLSAGSGDSDAATIGQLRLSGNALASGLGGGARYDPVSGAFMAPSYNVGGRSYGNVGSALTATNNLAVQYVADGNGNPTGIVDLAKGGASPVALRGVAAGRLAAGSTEAVNGDQLYTTNQQVARNTTDIATNAGGLTDLRQNIVAGSIGLVRQDAASRALTVGAGTDGALVDFVNGSGTARTLTGVAAGRVASGSFDAVNGSQLYDLGQRVDTGNASNSSFQNAVTNGTVGLVRQDPANGDITVGAATQGTRVSLRNGAGGTRLLTGLSAGSIAANSTDAVNGAQLSETNQRVAGNTTDIATNAAGLGDLRQGIQSGTVGLVQQDGPSRTLTVGKDTDGTLVDLTGTQGLRRLTGLSAGSGDSDAATIGQLRLSGNALASGLGGGASYDAVSGAFTAPSYNVGGRSYGNVGAALAASNSLAVQYVADGNGNPTGTVDLAKGGATPISLRGVAPGQLAYGSTDAVNGDQLYRTNQQVASLSGGVANGTVGLLQQDPTTGALRMAATTGGTSLSLVNGDGAARTITGVAAGSLAAGSTAAVNGGQLYQTNQQVANLNTAILQGTVGLVQQDSVSRGLTIGAGTDGTTIALADQNGRARTLTGVGAGQIAAGSSQGVNGGQIYAVTGSLATALGGGAGVANDGTLTAPRYSVQGNTYTSVGGALGSLDAAVTNLNTSGSRYVAVNSTGPAAQAQGVDTVAIGPGAVASSGRGVALGSGSVASRSGMNGALEAFSGNAVASTQGAVSVGDVSSERQITNVAGGTQGTDAVNLRQLRAVGGNLAGALGGGAAFAADGSFTAPTYGIGGQLYASVGAALGAIDTLGVKYDVDPAAGGRGQSITLAGGDPNQPVLIRNVATGILPTDAATVGQVTRAKADANAYTDRSVATVYAAGTAYTDAAVAPLQRQMSAFGSQLADLNRQVGEVRGEARRGAAIGLAAAALRFDDRPGKLSVAAGGGVWRGESAGSVGIGYTLPDGSARVNATGVAAGRDFGVGAGASFTLN
jgi:trimeric autotransporter adhesin